MINLIQRIKQFMGKCPSCKGFGTMPDGTTCRDCWGQAMIEIIIFEIARAIGLLLCIILPAYAFAKSDIDEEM